MSRSTRAAGRRAAPRATRSRHRSHRARTTSKAIGLTLVSALVPGSGLLMGGRKKLGAFVLTISIGLLLIGAYVGLTRRDSILAIAVSPRQLLVATGAVVLLGICWIWIVVASHKLLRPVSMTYTGRLAGSMFVGLLCFAIAVPTTVAAQTVMAQRDLVGSVFQSEGNSKSATRPKVNKNNPWANTERLNLLLLGADDGIGRTGVRTDTVIVASIDTKTGNTSLISLSRNWMRMPFPEDSPLHKVYPDGYWDPSKGNVEQPEYYLDSMYDNIPKQHPGILGQTDNEGADAVKLAAGAALGLDIDYYMQVNLAGFRQIIDAVGGITVNVNYRVPIGGDYGEGPGNERAPPAVGLHRAGPEPEAGRVPRAVVRPRPVRPERPVAAGTPALHDPRAGQQREPGHPGDEVPADRVGRQAAAAHRHPTGAAGGIHRARPEGEERERHQRRPGQEQELPHRQEPGLHGDAGDRAEGDRPEDQVGRVDADGQADQEAERGHDEEDPAEAGRHPGQHAEPERRLRLQPQPDRELTEPGARVAPAG